MIPQALPSRIAEFCLDCKTDNEVVSRLCNNIPFLIEFFKCASEDESWRNNHSESFNNLATTLSDMSNKLSLAQAKTISKAAEKVFADKSQSPLTKQVTLHLAKKDLVVNQMQLETVSGTLKQMLNLSLLQESLGKEVNLKLFGEGETKFLEQYLETGQIEGLEELPDEELLALSRVAEFLDISGLELQILAHCKEARPELFKEQDFAFRLSNKLSQIQIPGAAVKMHNRHLQIEIFDLNKITAENLASLERLGFEKEVIIHTSSNPNLLILTDNLTKITNLAVEDDFMTSIKRTESGEVVHMFSLTAFPNLVQLRLKDINIRSSDFAKCPNLEVLSITTGRVIDLQPEHVEDLNLKKIILDRAHGFTKEALLALAKPGLEVLDLRPAEEQFQYDESSPQTILGKESLFKIVTTCQSLKELHLRRYYSTFGEDTIKSIADKNPNLRAFTFEERIDGKVALPVLSKFRDIEYIGLNLAEIPTEQAIAFIESCPNCKTIHWASFGGKLRELPVLNAIIEHQKGTEFLDLSDMRNLDGVNLSGLKNLSTINLPADITSEQIGSLLENCDSIRTVRLPNMTAERAKALVRVCPQISYLDNVQKSELPQLVLFPQLTEVLISTAGIKAEAIKQIFDQNAGLQVIHDDIKSYYRQPSNGS